MTDFDAGGCRQTLFEALLEARASHGGDRVILKDADGTALSYDRLVLGSLVLGRKLSDLAPAGEPVGLMLPNAAGFLVALLGLNAFGRTAAIINYTAGSRNILAAARLARLSTIVTSRRFIDKANLQPVIDDLAAAELVRGRRTRIEFLEDVRAAIGTADKLRGWLEARRRTWFRSSSKARSGDTAVILFTSGTEGTPKGVALANSNIVSNARQVFAQANGHLSKSDRVLNPLPMFHSFGLTAGTFVPLLNGMPVTLYPSPLHYREVARLMRAEQSTVLFTTDTFAAGYARAAKPGDLDSLRIVVAGAERVKDATRQLWSGTNALIIEGYGATECAPVIAVNTPDAMRHGTVGRILPGIEHRLVPVDGLIEGGRLEVRGPNVMAGYIEPCAPGVLARLKDGWHDTGDIVAIEDGFITIRGRAKRFAKLAGEMVSLAAVESLAAGCWPDGNHVVVSLPDAKKGEQLILVTDKADAERDVLLAYARAHGFPELWLPRALLVVAAIPMLGSGKTDFPATAEMARQSRPML